MSTQPDLVRLRDTLLVERTRLAALQQGPVCPWQDITDGRVSGLTIAIAIINEHLIATKQDPTVVANGGAR